MKKIFYTILILCITISMSAAFIWTKSKPKIVITPKQPLIDQPVEITVSNLPANEEIAIEASCKDNDNNVWTSHATFQADENGVVNVAKQAPISGSYTGVDAMGLVWSIAPANNEVLQRTGALNTLEIELSVFCNDKLRAKKIMHRLAVLPDVERKEIREQGLVGTLFYPKNLKNGPGVIVVGGSGGRIPEYFAQLLASHGYAALALGFFRVEGLPKKLENIPLEYFQTAIQWFKQQPQVDKTRVAITGRSRGGELVLLLAATFPDQIQAVVAYVPSSVVWAGMSDGSKPAWTYKGQPVSFIKRPSEEEMSEAEKQGLVPHHSGTFDDPIESTSIYLYIMKRFSQDIEAATISVEKITCPILLISAEDDKMWPSTMFSEMVMKRLDDKKSTIVRKHLQFPSAGHGVQNPYGPTPGRPYFHPVTQSWMTIGGTAAGNARADKEAWKGVLSFLKESLQS